MRCGFGWDGGECIPDHWLRVQALRLHRSGDASPHWRGVCPMCGVDDALEVSDKGGTIAWRCWRDPRCEQGELRAIVYGLVICQLAAPAAPPRAGMVPRAEVESLIGLSGAALKLRVACIGWNCTPQEAADKLGMPGRTYRRAVTEWPNLARNRR